MEVKFSISNFITILLCVFSSRTTLAVNSKFDLPAFIQPIKYKLELLIDVQHKWLNYEERVTITVKCVEEKTDEIYVNVKRSYLIIKEENVRVKLSESTSHSESSVEIRNHEYDVENDIHIIQLSTPLEVDKVYEVMIPFEKSGSLKLTGFYVDEHEDASKNGSEFIASQLGPADARGIFPCLDQIKFKVPFKVFLKHSGNLWGFGNMRRIDTKEVILFYSCPYCRPKPKRHLVEDEFEESLPMSTNNIAFVLIDSKIFQQLDMSDGPIQLYAAETIIKNMQEAYSVSQLAMNFYSEYFGSPYTSSTLNMIALPNFHDKDKAKYGIMTFSDSSISFPGNSRTDIALYICHAMSHQWLGTHVTVSSWNIYWLLEAFAYFLEKPCLKSLFPEQELSYFDSQLVKTITLLLPYEMEDPSYTMLDFDYFDKIDKYGLEDAVFAKAFCLVQMLNFAFGDELFKKFLASYMKTSYSAGTSLEYVGNVFTQIIHDSQTFSYHIDVNEYMNSWMSKKGFPLLTVTRSKNGKSVKIAQKNFQLFYDHDEALILDKSCWMMPLRFTTSKDKEPGNNKIHHWINCVKPFRTGMNWGKNDWMIVDLRWNVLCRVNYDYENWNAIQSLLMNPEEYSRINELSRVQLISDMFAFADIGILSYDWVFNSMKYLVHEYSFLPMTVAVNELLKIRDRLFGSEILFPLFEEYVRKILEVKFEKQRAGAIADSSQTNREKDLFERLIIKSSCLFDVQQCHNLGQEFFKKWYTSGQEEEEIDDDREPYYCQAMKFANTNEWEFLRKQYDVKKGSKFITDILMALGCSNDEIILKYYLKWSIGHVLIAPQISPEDSPKVFSSVAMNEKGYLQMKNSILNNFQSIKTFLSESSVSIDFYLKRLLDITTKSNDMYDLQMIILNNYGKYDDFLTNFRRAERNIWWWNEYNVKLKLYLQSPSLSSEFEQNI